VFSGLPSGRPFFVNTYFAQRGRPISILGGEISMKLDTNVHHVSGHCQERFEGQRSKVKVVTRPNVIMRRCVLRRWCRGLLVF